MRECGRSMVEMLGVLAIVGVLSVGAISGYSKAMMKYKLNKQTEQIGSILDYATLHYDNLDRLGHQDYSMTPLFSKLGIIPVEMIKDQNPYYIYDVFNNKVLLFHNLEPGIQQYFGMAIFINQNTYDICMNLFQMSKLRSALLWQTMFVRDNEDVSGEHTNRAFGDAHCTNNRTCLKDLSLSQMHELCKTCDDTTSCSFQILWNMERVS